MIWNPGIQITFKVIIPHALPPLCHYVNNYEMYFLFSLFYIEDGTGMNISRNPVQFKNGSTFTEDV